MSLCLAPFDVAFALGFARWSGDGDAGGFFGFIYKFFSKKIED